jgi:DNA repair photolyase
LQRFERVFYLEPMAEEKLFEIARRTFDTPEFRGIEFIEAECKTIINHVPGNYLPFKYTINPYRGCSHSCTYCVGPDTEVLTADGRTKPIAKLGVGDRIYGTERVGWYRRYVITDVLAHWETVKPAYRITLEDGTEVIASGDHRFLSERGWKYVMGAEQGPYRRPFLTTNNSLLGLGGFGAAPVEDDEYRRGYLTGMIRGDALLASYTYLRSNGRIAASHQFRLALIDADGLERTRQYLSLEGIGTTTFTFQAASDNGRALGAIRTQRRDHIERIRDLIAWPHGPSISWRKGFLAGIFDAEGTCVRDVIRIANTDVEVIRWITTSLDALEFTYVVEDAQRCNGLKNVRLLGGLRERVAFLHTVDPAIARKRSIEGVAVKSDAPLGVVGIEDLGVELPMFDITTGTGDFIANGVVSHNCFARPTHTYLDMNAGKDFETKIVVKVNAPDVLRRQLGAKKWKGDGIAMGTNTDPYQRAEGRYKLMPRIIEALTDYRNPFSILTKGTLILRDLHLLVEAAKVTDIATAFSIGTLDEDVWRKSEPGTPHPRARMEAVASLNAAGIPCGILMAPVLPGISDHPDQLREVVTAAIGAGATHVSPILLHLRPGVREEFMPWLAETYPDLVAKYEQMYRTPYGPPADRNALGAAVGDLVRNAGGTRPAPERPRRWRTSERDRGMKPEQLELI